MAMKPLKKKVKNQVCVVLVLHKEVELNGLYYFLVGHFEDWTCGEIHRRGHAFFELQVYLLQQLMVNSVAGSPT